MRNDYEDAALVPIEPRGPTMNDTRAPLVKYWIDGDGYLTNIEANGASQAVYLASVVDPVLGEARKLLFRVMPRGHSHECLTITTPLHIPTKCDCDYGECERLLARLRA